MHTISGSGCKSDLAQNLQNAQIKVDDGQLRHQEESDKIELWREELKNIKIPSKGG
jgi:hypothetical protein